MSSLVIVESPAKCSKIQGFLGDGWKVVATFGHIRALEDDLSAVGIDRDFEPQYQFIKEKAKAIQNLKAAARGADTIYLASDDDREGEAIAYSTAILLGLDPAKVPRAVFHEITATAVKKAIANPRLIDMNRVNAQQARSVLDMLVGFTISPLLWNRIAPASSAGRCQTPALRILVDREKEIQSFTSSTVWRLKGTWSSSNGTFTFPAVLKDELEDKESALNFLENIHETHEGTVLSAIVKPWSESPPKPLITSTLQQEASASFSCPPKKTMMIAQRLYEAGHITYMRTDHPILSDEAKEAAADIVKKLYGDSYIATATEAPKKKKEKEGAVEAQEAHEAIRPTHFENRELPADEQWDTIDKRIYKLIWNRAVQSIMASAKGDERIAIFTADGDPGEFPWEARWKRTTFLGWKKIGSSTSKLDETEVVDDADVAQSTWIQAMSIREGDKIKWNTLEAQPHISKSPPRFNEATLVRELEKRGIGRPSTYASLVGTILDKKYAEIKDKPAETIRYSCFTLDKVNQWPPKEQKLTKQVGAEKHKMVPTTLGQSLLDFCLQEFPNLFDYNFTALMESRLDKIAQGEELWKQVCRDTWSSYKDNYQRLKVEKSDSKNNASQKVHQFSDGYKAVLGKKGPILLQEDSSGDKEKTKFFGWPEGVEFNNMTEEAAMRFIDDKKRATAAAAEANNSVWGTYNDKSMIERKGPFGKYIECGGIKVPLVDGDTVETIQKKIAEKQNANLHSLGDFEFRRGQFGAFMFKKTSHAKKPVFVSLPDGLDPKTLTLEAAKRIYQNGIEQKKEAGYGGIATRGSRGGRGGKATRGGRGGKSTATVGRNDTS